MQDGYSALMFASLRGYAAIVDLLLQHNAQVDLQDNVSTLLLHYDAPSACTQLRFAYPAIVVHALPLPSFAFHSSGCLLQ